MLYFVLNIIEIEETLIKNIDESFVGKTIRTTGNIKSLTSRGNTFISLVDESEILVVIFKDSEIETSNLEENQQIEVTGVVEEYKDELEIIAKKVIRK